MRLTFEGTVVELGIDYDIAGHVHNGMLIDCAGARLIFVEMPPEQLRRMPLYAALDVTIEVQAALRRDAPPVPMDDARDAARYRYLRDSPHFNIGRLLDQSIDEAMKERR
jgi:hypothetical protein